MLDRALELHKTGSAGTRSGLEDRFLKLIRGARLPEPLVNMRHRGFELDFRWPRLNVEIDGDHHDRPRSQRDDRIQDAVLRANGFVVLRFREEHLERPEEVLRQLASQQLSRGVSR
jgi:very-short-patch-repair endonuclease